MNMKNKNIIESFNLHEELDESMYHDIIIKLPLNYILLNMDNFIDENEPKEYRTLVQYLVVNKFIKQNIVFYQDVYSADSETIKKILLYLDIDFKNFYFDDNENVLSLQSKDKENVINILNILMWYDETDINNILIFKPKFKIYENNFIDRE